LTPVGDVPAHCPGECRVSARGFDRIRVTVSLDNEPAQALYERCGYRDVGVPPRRVQGSILIRTGPIEVDDTLLTWEKSLGGTDPVRA